MIKLLFWVSLIMGISGCARLSSLNNKSHRYGTIPQKIVWIQLAGFSNEHLMMLKVGGQRLDKQTALEKASCSGSMWSYNLINLRPAARESFLSQMSGKSPELDTCQNFLARPFWKYPSVGKVNFAVLESNFSSENSLLKSKTCGPEKVDYLNETIFFSMRKKDGATGDLFHREEKNTGFSAGKIYFDKSCQQGNCFSEMSENFVFVFNQLLNQKENFVYVLRDFSFLEKLQKHNFAEAREVLSQIEKIYAILVEYAQAHSDFLVLLTSAQSLPIELPSSVSEWKDFEKRLPVKNYKESSLLEPVLALGARAENFCGIFEQSDLFSRIFGTSNEVKSGYYLVNPFD